MRANNGMSPLRNPFQRLFHASLLILGTVIALKVAVDLLSHILPWIAGAIGAASLLWGAVALIRWRRSRW